MFYLTKIEHRKLYIVYYWQSPFVECICSHYSATFLLISLEEEDTTGLILTYNNSLTYFQDVALYNFVDFRINSFWSNFVELLNCVVPIFTSVLLLMVFIRKWCFSKFECDVWRPMFVVCTINLNIKGELDITMVTICIFGPYCLVCIVLFPKKSFFSFYISWKFCIKFFVFFLFIGWVFCPSLCVLGDGVANWTYMFLCSGW